MTKISSHLSFISCLFLCLVFYNILSLLLTPYPCSTFTKQSSCLFACVKLFLETSCCTFFNCLFRLLLELLIFKDLVDTFVCSFTHLIIIFLVYCLILLLGLVRKNRFSSRIFRSLVFITLNFFLFLFLATHTK